jgi:hypothetical protein
MRKLVVLSFVSLDGVMQAPGGKDEDPSGGFDLEGWTVPFFDEVMGEDNDFISAWDSNTAKSFCGIDSPKGRDFTPKHNSFYFALPAKEFTEDGIVKGAREASPWANEISSLGEDESLFKGRWVRLESEGREAYAQWHNVGPSQEDDYAYVFGTKEPANTFGEQAGIDLSPDAANTLAIDGSGAVTWNFVKDSEVPEGPWSQHPPIDNKTLWE